MPYTYEFPRPSLTADCILFGYRDDRLSILLIQRAKDPYQGKWAFPGGFMDMDENVEQAAHRELEEETGLKGVSFEQFHTFSAVDRDPRGRVVSVAFMGFVHEDHYTPQASDDAENARWVPLQEVNEMAFDHAGGFKMAVAYLKEMVQNYPLKLDNLLKNFSKAEKLAIYHLIKHT